MPFTEYAVSIPGKSEWTTSRIPDGWDLIGEISCLRKGSPPIRGALVRNPKTGVWARVTSGALSMLDPRKLETALQQAASGGAHEPDDKIGQAAPKALAGNGTRGKRGRPPSALKKTVATALSPEAVDMLGEIANKLFQGRKNWALDQMIREYYARFITKNAR